MESLNCCSLPAWLCKKPAIGSVNRCNSSINNQWHIDTIFWAPNTFTEFIYIKRGFCDQIVFLICIPLPPPQGAAATARPPSACGVTEATCNNGQCIDRLASLVIYIWPELNRQRPKHPPSKIYIWSRSQLTTIKPPTLQMQIPRLRRSPRLQRWQRRGSLQSGQPLWTQRVPGGHRWQTDKQTSSTRWGTNEQATSDCDQFGQLAWFKALLQY